MGFRTEKKYSSYEYFSGRETAVSVTNTSQLSRLGFFTAHSTKGMQWHKCILARGFFTAPAQGFQI